MVTCGKLLFRYFYPRSDTTFEAKSLGLKSVRRHACWSLSVSARNADICTDIINEFNQIILQKQEHGAAYEAGGLEVGQLILEVDSTKVQGMQHQVQTLKINQFKKYTCIFFKQDVARLIAECYANRDRNEITFLVVEAKKSNLEPKPTALVFLEQ